MPIQPRPSTRDLVLPVATVSARVKNVDEAPRFLDSRETTRGYS